MLPYSGTFAQLGENITTAFEMHLAESGGKLGGRAVTVIRLDDAVRPGRGAAERQPAAEPGQGRRAGRHRPFRRGDGAGAGGAREGRAADHPQCRQRRGHARAVLAKACSAPRSATGSRPTAWARALAAKGVKKAAWVTLGLRGRQGIRRGLPRRPEGRRGGTGADPDRCRSRRPTSSRSWRSCPAWAWRRSASFFAGGGAVQFVRDYAAAGLRDKLPLCGSGFLTEGTLAAQGAAAEGIRTALHYGDGLDNAQEHRLPRGVQGARRTGRRTSTRCRAMTPGRCWRPAGRDQGRRGRGQGAVRGHARRQDRQPARRLHAVRRRTTRCRTSTCARPRAAQNRVIGIAAEALADPGTGCKMPAILWNVPHGWPSPDPRLSGSTGEAAQPHVDWP